MATDPVTEKDEEPAVSTPPVTSYEPPVAVPAPIVTASLLPWAGQPASSRTQKFDYGTHFTC